MKLHRAALFNSPRAECSQPSSFLALQTWKCSYFADLVLSLFLHALSVFKPTEILISFQVTSVGLVCLGCLTVFNSAKYLCNQRLEVLVWPRLTSLDFPKKPSQNIVSNKTKHGANNQEVPTTTYRLGQRPDNDFHYFLQTPEPSLSKRWAFNTSVTWTHQQQTNDPPKKMYKQG